MVCTGCRAQNLSQPGIFTNPIAPTSPCGTIGNGCLCAGDGLKGFFQKAPLKVGEISGVDIVAERLPGPQLLELVFEAEQREQLKRFQKIAA